MGFCVFFQKRSSDIFSTAQLRRVHFLSIIYKILRNSRLYKKHVKVSSTVQRNNNLPFLSTVNLFVKNIYIGNNTLHLCIFLNIYFLRVPLCYQKRKIYKGEWKISNGCICLKSMWIQCIQACLQSFIESAVRLLNVLIIQISTKGLDSFAPKI